MMQSSVFYVELVLPLALPGTYTYHADSTFNGQLVEGQRVVVQFGKHKIYSALVWNVMAAPPSFETKPVIAIVDELPVITRSQMKLWQWMADYYACTLGEIMAAALPSALRLQSESVLQLHPEFNNTDQLNERESVIVEALQAEKELSIARAAKLLNLKQVMPVIKSLLLRSVIILVDELINKYKPRVTTFVSLTEKAKDEIFMRQMMDALEKRSQKQLDLLLAFLQLSGDTDSERIPRALLLRKANAGSAALNALVKKGVLETGEQAVDRMINTITDVIPPLPLNDSQANALSLVRKTFSLKKVSLLHGVTSSGKTELYIHLLNDVLKKGRQALYLLPEIALTTQIISRLQKHFGSSLHVYHSRFNDNERVEVWNKVLKNNFTDEAMIVIGARSAVFLPFNKLAMVIVDEEHDTSYKQVDPAPRYNARDTAIWFGKFANADVLLGTATPSVESYYNALAEKYILTEIPVRYGDFNMPHVELVDLKEAYKRKMMNSHFSSVLLDAIKYALEKGEQVILFQNRRGFAPVLECRNCSWVPHCINCDVSLTLHKHNQELRCHYCGYTCNPPSACNACGSSDLRMKGFGTEKIEEELQIILPDFRIARLDHDTTRSRNNFHQLINEFDNGEIDILVGTQMVTKGLDFKNVSLVGILNADQLLNFPDFRAHERSFQLFEQVSGRAGRKTTAGKVIIQTYNPSSSTLQFVMKHDYRGFYNHELIERNRFNYPPYYRLIECTIRHRDEAEAERAAKHFAAELASVFGQRVLGPTAPNVSRIRNYHLRQILLKLERKLSVDLVKKNLRKSIDFFNNDKQNRTVLLHVDVDPQ